MFLTVFVFNLLLLIVEVDTFSKSLIAKIFEYYLMVEAENMIDKNSIFISLITFIKNNPVNYLLMNISFLIHKITNSPFSFFLINFEGLKKIIDYPMNR